MMSSFEQLLVEARKMAAAHRALRSNGALREADAWFMKTEREGLLRGARFVALAPEQQLAVLKALDGEADAAAEKVQQHSGEENIWQRARLRGSEVPDRRFVQTFVLSLAALCSLVFFLDRGPIWYVLSYLGAAAVTLRAHGAPVNASALVQLVIFVVPLAMVLIPLFQSQLAKYVDSTRASNTATLDRARLDAIAYQALSIPAPGKAATSTPTTAPAPAPTAVMADKCGFARDMLPAEFVLFAAGAPSGRRQSYRIDDSGHAATRIDVEVDHRDKPVVLLLGAYEPTAWHLSWTNGTEIAAVLVGGYHRQVITGVPETTPMQISTHENNGTCGAFHVGGDRSDTLAAVALRAFHHSIDHVYLATDGKASVGMRVAPGTLLLSSGKATPDSFALKPAPRPGRAGLDDALRAGELRMASQIDLDAWLAAARRHGSSDAVRPPNMFNAYVVLKPFTYPGDLYGAHSATFFLAAGVPMPTGDPGHSTVYDLASGQCFGLICSIR